MTVKRNAKAETAVSSQRHAPAAAPPPSVTASRPGDSFEQQVLDELNAVRTNPVAYAAKIDALVPRFEGTLMKCPGKVNMNTEEGVTPVKLSTRWICWLLANNLE